MRRFSLSRKKENENENIRGDVQAVTDGLAPPVSSKQRRFSLSKNLFKSKRPNRSMSMPRVAADSSNAVQRRSSITAESLLYGGLDGFEDETRSTRSGPGRIFGSYFCRKTFRWGYADTHSTRKESMIHFVGSAAAAAFIVSRDEFRRESSLKAVRGYRETPEVTSEREVINLCEGRFKHLSAK